MGFKVCCVYMCVCVIQGPGLHEVLKPDLLVPLVRKEGMLDKLASHLPEEHRSVMGLATQAVLHQRSAHLPVQYCIVWLPTTQLAVCIPSDMHAPCVYVCACVCAHRTQEQLVATVRSPQFQQQLATFSAAMQTGQLDLAQFGLNAKVRNMTLLATGMVQQRIDTTRPTNLCVQMGSIYMQSVLQYYVQGFSVADFLTAIQEMVDKEKQQGAGSMQE